MKKKIGIGIILLVIGIAVIKSNNNVNYKGATNIIKITLNVYDKDNKNIYNKEIRTDEEYLIDVLKDTEELNIITEDSKYGEYITSIMGIEEVNNYYWVYYIGEEYATVGVSNCKLEEEKTYNFKIERYN